MVKIYLSIKKTFWHNFLTVKYYWPSTLFPTDHFALVNGEGEKRFFLTF